MALQEATLAQASMVSIHQAFCLIRILIQQYYCFTYTGFNSFHDWKFVISERTVIKVFNKFI
jgi:hypothetical protein